MMPQIAQHGGSIIPEHALEQVLRDRPMKLTYGNEVLPGATSTIQTVNNTGDTPMQATDEQTQVATHISAQIPAIPVMPSRNDSVFREQAPPPVDSVTTTWRAT